MLHSVILEFVFSACNRYHDISYYANASIMLVLPERLQQVSGQFHQNSIILLPPRRLQNKTRQSLGSYVQFTIEKLVVRLLNDYSGSHLHNPISPVCHILPNLSIRPQLLSFSPTRRHSTRHRLLHIFLQFRSKLQL